MGPAVIQTSPPGRRTIITSIVDAHLPQCDPQLPLATSYLSPSPVAQPLEELPFKQVAPAGRISARECWTCKLRHAIAVERPRAWMAEMKNGNRTRRRPEVAPISIMGAPDCRPEDPLMRERLWAVSCAPMEEPVRWRRRLAKANGKGLGIK